MLNAGEQVRLIATQSIYGGPFLVFDGDLSNGFQLSDFGLSVSQQGNVMGRYLFLGSRPLCCQFATSPALWQALSFCFILFSCLCLLHGEHLSTLIGFSVYTVILLFYFIFVEYSNHGYRSEIRQAKIF